MPVVLLLATSFCVRAADDCSFPRALTERPRWESQVKKEHRSVDLFFKFYENRMDIIEYQVDDTIASTYECVRSLPTKTAFVVRMRNVETPSGFSYKCVQFTMRSENVVEMKESMSAGSDSTTMCDDGNMKSNPWPLIWPQTSGSQPGLITGGYDMEIRNARGKTLCKTMAPQPRLESNCMADEGLMLYFRQFDCRGTLSMDLEQRLFSLGRWKDGDYAYSILTDNDKMWPKLWMLRSPAKLTTDRLVVQLYSDVFIDRGDSSQSTSMYYTLVLTRTLFTSLCQDEAKDCSSCIDGNSFYCQKSCGLCHYAPKAKTCQFPESTQGEWTAKDGEVTFGVSGPSMRIKGMPELRCLQLNTLDDWYRNSGVQAVAAIFENGCRPRYSCVDLHRRSASVLQYRLGKSLVWPHSVTLLVADVCTPRAFENPARSGTKTVLRAAGNSTAHSAADCGIEGRIALSGYYDGVNCTGTLNSCESPGIVSLQLERHGRGTVTKFRCIASYKQQSSRILLAESYQASNELLCWIFRRNRWTGQHTAYLIPSVKCGNKIADDIEWGLFSQYTGAFQLGRTAACSPLYSSFTGSVFDVNNSITTTGPPMYESSTPLDSHENVEETTPIVFTTDALDTTTSLISTTEPSTTAIERQSNTLTHILTSIKITKSATAPEVILTTTSFEATSTGHSTVVDTTEGLRQDSTSETRTVVSDVTNAARHVTVAMQRSTSSTVTSSTTKSTTTMVQSTTQTVMPPRGSNNISNDIPPLVTRKIPPSKHSNDTYALGLRSAQSRLAISLLMLAISVCISFAIPSM